MYFELLYQCSETGLDEEEVPRNLAWKRARKNKAGVYHPEVQSIVETIVSE